MLNSSKQQTLGLAHYPVGRPAFFAIRFQCHVLRRGVAYEVGTDGLAILMLVSTAEDRTRYSKPIAFWNDHLCGMVGLSRERFFAARKKLVERGWLCYTAGARGRAPTYFVTVPGGDEQIDSSALGESSADELTEELGRISRPSSPPIAVSIPHQSPTQFTTPSILIPESEKPSSLSPERTSELDTLPAPPLPREEDFEEAKEEGQPPERDHERNDPERSDQAGSRDGQTGWYASRGSDRFTVSQQHAAEDEEKNDFAAANSEEASPSLGREAGDFARTRQGEGQCLNTTQKMTKRMTIQSTTETPTGKPFARSVMGPVSMISQEPRASSATELEWSKSLASHPELLQMLRDEFKITRASWTLQEALRFVPLEHVAAVVGFARSQQIGEQKPWGAGAVVRRLTDPDLVGMAPQEGWATPNAEWSKIDARRQREAQAERERLAKVKELQDDEARRVAALAARQQLELDFGVLVDQVEQSAPDRLWSILKRKGIERVVRSSPKGLRGEVARLQLLRAAEAGELR